MYKKSHCLVGVSWEANAMGVNPKDTSALSPKADMQYPTCNHCSLTDNRCRACSP
uniref:Uncharacterized protein n=1 Tax=Arion vulgaris TaxID=1028688 RepID=A0A0B6YTT4_9EUPU